MKINWLWDTRLPETRVKRILKNEKDPRFYIYAEKLFSRVSDPKIAFKYVPKNVFFRNWPVIRKRVSKDTWQKGKVDFWQNIYNQRDIQSAADISFERMNVAQQIKKIRIKIGYTQQDMADKLGVIQQFVSKLETGRENLTLDTLRRIADVLEKRLVVRLD